MLYAAFFTKGLKVLKTKLSYIYIVCAAVLWGTMGIFVNKLSGFGFSSMQIVFARAVVAAAALICWLLITDRSLLRIKFRDWPIFIGTGVVSFMCFSFCYFTAMRLSSLSVAAVLLYTAPAFVMIMSAFLFKERLNLYKAAAVCLTVLGCALVTGAASGNASVSAAGVLFGLGAGLGYALYSIFGRFGLEKYSTLTVTAYTFVFAAAAALPFSELPELIGKITSPVIMLWLIAAGIVTCVMPYLFYTTALARVEPGRASVIAAVEPVVAALFGVFLYGEQLDIFKIAGIALVFAAVALINVRKR